MSQNNKIRKSDKKFIRLEKARIRATVLDLKKREELISALYQRFLGDVVTGVVKEAAVEKKEKQEPIKEPKKTTAKTKKVTSKSKK